MLVNLKLHVVLVGLWLDLVKVGQQSIPTLIQWLIRYKVLSPKKSLKVKTMNENLIKNLVMQINHVWSNLQHLALFCDVLFSTTLYAVAYKSLMTKAISWLSSFPNTPSSSMKVNLILIELLCSRLLFWWPRKDTYES